MWLTLTAIPRSRIPGKARRNALRSPYNPQKVSASMGIYIFNTDVLIPVLLKDAEDPNIPATTLAKISCQK